MKYRALTCGVFIVLIVANACKSKQEAPRPKEKFISDSTMKLLTIDTVSSGNSTNEVKLTGEVSFNENRVVKIYPFSSGQVISTNVSVGDYVKAGQVLATIKSADIAGNYADLNIAENDVTIARRNMNNAEQLYKNGISSEKEYAEAKENYNKATATAGKYNQQIRINGGGRTNANGTYTVTSPRSGYVVEKLINPGNFIRTDNSNNLFTIGDISDVWIWANVYETDIAKVRPGYTAEVTTLAYPNTTFNGKVDNVGQTLDPVSKVMRVKIVLPNSNNMLKPEMFANILVKNTERSNILSVPASAVISENGKNYVVVFNNQEDVKIQEINILKTTENRTYLISGVAAGQKVITQNQILVYQKIKETQIH